MNSDLNMVGSGQTTVKKKPSRKVKLIIESQKQDIEHAVDIKENLKDDNQTKPRQTPPTILVNEPPPALEVSESPKNFKLLTPTDSKFPDIKPDSVTINNAKPNEIVEIQTNKEPIVRANSIKKVTQ